MGHEGSAATSAVWSAARKRDRNGLEGFIVYGGHRAVLGNLVWSGAGDADFEAEFAGHFERRWPRIRRRKTARAGSFRRRRNGDGAGVAGSGRTRDPPPGRALERGSKLRFTQIADIREFPPRPDARREPRDYS